MSGSKISCWFNLETFCALPGRCYGFFVNPWRKPWTIATCFERFGAHNSKINPDKGEFFKKIDQLLCHIVKADGLEVDHSKTKAVQIFPIPRSQTDVMSFLGQASYYRRFVPKFAEKARPLHKASETLMKFEWRPAAQHSVESLNLKLTSTPILAFACLKELLIVYTDASQFAMGAVLAMLPNHSQNHKQRTPLHAPSFWPS